MAITRLSGGNTPANAADPRTFPAIWNGTADDLEAGEYAFLPPNSSATGVYLATAGSITSTAVPQGESITDKMPIGAAISIDRLAVTVVAAGASGSVVRLGIYRFSDDGSGLSLVVDGGTIDGTSTGNQEVTVSASLTPGMYLPVAFAQGSPATNPSLRAKTGALALVPAAFPAFATHVGGGTGNAMRLTGVAGALPATLGYPAFVTTSQPIVGVRVA